jgi:hypothetical protein
MMMRAQLGHLPLMYAFTQPLLVGDAVRVARDGEPVRWLRLALLLSVAFLCSVYYLVFGGLAYLVIVGVAAVRAHTWVVFARTGAAALLAFAVLSPIIVARFDLDRSEHAAGAPSDLGDDAQQLSPDVLGVIVPPSRSTFGFPGLDRLADRRLVLPSPGVEGSVFVGLALDAALVVFACRRSRLRLPLLVAIGAVWVLSLGPSARWGSTRYLVNRLDRALLNLPALGSLRVPERAGVVLTALLAATFAVVCGDVFARWRDARVVQVGVVAIAVLVATNAIVPLPWSKPVSDAAARRAYVLIRHERGPHDAVMRVPADCDFSQAEFAKTQIVHRAPIVGCTGSFAAARWYTRLAGYVRAPAFNALRCDLTKYGRLTTPGPSNARWDAASVAALRQEFGVRYLVVDRVALLAGNCRAVLRVSESFGGYRVLAADGHVAVVDLAP